MSTRFGDGRWAGIVATLTLALGAGCGTTGDEAHGEPQVNEPGQTAADAAAFVAGDVDKEPETCLPPVNPQGESGTLPIPADVRVEQDDRVATVRWNDAHALDLPEGVAGYWIRWNSVARGCATRAQLADSNVAQLQLLEPGVEYEAEIRSVDVLGRVSAASPKIRFHHDAARVDALRAKMNGFFDDFNRPSGAFDELRWNNAYSGCVGSGTGGQFVNTQFHAHSMLAALNCDRGQNISRPRAVFDFSGRTGTITFDLDGNLRRDQWYLDINDASIANHDIFGHVDLEAIDDENAYSNPANTLRIHQNGDAVHVFVFDGHGVERELQPASQDVCTDLRFCPNENLHPVNNVRRHWRIEVSKTRCTVFINDQKVADANLASTWHPQGLPYEKATVQWITFSYNTPKANELSVMNHWDNFGFDSAAPPATITTHNYTDGNIGPPSGAAMGTDWAATSRTSPLARTIPIPDAIQDTTGALPVAARLMFTVQATGGKASYEHLAEDHVVVDGVAVPVARPAWTPGMPAGDDIRLTGPYTPYTIVVPLDPSKLRTGNNDVTFNLGDDTGVFNVHIELDYPVAKAPPYTQPSAIHPSYADVLNHAHATIGPAAAIFAIDGNSEACGADGGAHGALPTGLFTEYEESMRMGECHAAPVKGTVPIRIGISDEIGMIGVGKIQGVQRWELLVDGAVVDSQTTDLAVAAPSVFTDAKLPSAQLCNGRHRLELRAFGPSGAGSIPDYFQGATKAGDSYPVFIETLNDGAPSCP